VLGLVAAVLFLITCILEFTRYPAMTDTLLTTAGFIFVPLYLAGLVPGRGGKADRARPMQ
jgi:hypothetical protein